MSNVVTSAPWTQWVHIEELVTRRWCNVHTYGNAFFSSISFFSYQGCVEQDTVATDKSVVAGQDSSDLENEKNKKERKKAYFLPVFLFC